DQGVPMRGEGRLAWFVLAGAVLVLAAIAAASAVVGSAGISDEALKSTLSALRAKPPPAPPTPPSPPVKCADPTASLRPPARMPRPGHMPPGSYMATLYRHGRLIAGVNQNFLLFGYLNPFDGRLEGFEIDIAREVAKAIFGRPDAIEFNALTVPERIPFVQQGTVDLVADAVTITCDRRQQVDFSTVYYEAGQRVLVPSGSRARSLDDLAHKRVCATADSVPLDLIAHYRSHPVPYPAEPAPARLAAL